MGREHCTSLEYCHFSPSSSPSDGQSAVSVSLLGPPQPHSQPEQEIVMATRSYIIHDTLEAIHVTI